MKDRTKVSMFFRVITVLLMAVGAISFIYGLYTDQKLAWSHYLVVNYYFLSIAMGGAFFLAIQRITQSGWSSAFLRVPEAMMAYIPVAAVFFLLFYFGIHYIYPWADKEVVSADHILSHKSGFLNVPFFYARIVIYFTLWVIFLAIIRKLSLKEDSLPPGDTAGIMSLFARSEMFAKIFIFIAAITWSIAAFDWTMSVDSHWYSSVFAFKNTISAFLHGVTIMILIIFILYKRGYFPFMNKFHLHDFARYVFMLSIIWGYFWFAQFMIIWYGNIPAETSYFFTRWQNGWKILFFLEIGLNWGVPFMVLLPVATNKRMVPIIIVLVFLIIGQYIEIFLQVIPATTGVLKLGLTGAGLFIGYAGLFALVVAIALSKAKIIPSNHPYLEESFNHHFH